jgi:hypothetical protein
MGRFKVGFGLGFSTSSVAPNGLANLEVLFGLFKVDFKA